jgi:hypothetical protein
VSNRSEPSSTHSKSDGALGNFTDKQEGLVEKDRAHLPSTRGLLTRSSTRGIMSPGLDEEEQGGSSMSWPTRSGYLGQEASNRGDLEDRYRTKSYK